MKITFPEALPVSRHRDSIREAVEVHPVTIVCGDTGSGKTTQLPKIALQLGRGQAQRIGCTQPRRIAATSVAKRVADELNVNLGQEVGYQIRFEDQTSPETQVKFMTDGILLAETRGDRKLGQYDTLIIDEAHERSLNVDFILGYLQRLLPQRPDLKIIISSATLDAGTFADFFGGAPVIQVEGRTFPVEDFFQPPQHDRERLADQIARAVLWLGEFDSLGDTLVFLPGEREIRDAAELLAGRSFPNTAVLSLYGRQAGADQQRIFKPSARERRVILATNVAETSLTIPGIRFVIDSGLARVNRYDPVAGIQRLQIERISKASARQRRGRCGRISEGICVRLYKEEEFAEMRDYSDPEILRSNLAGVVLQMEHLGLGEPAKFPFIDPPQPKRIAQAYRVLEEIGALEKRGGLTATGRTLARLPLDPRVGRILIAAREEDCLREALIVASALTVQDPRERPQDAREAADQAHARFRDKTSDFTGWLRLWFALQENRKSNNALRRFCAKNFLNYRRAQEWLNLHRELRDLLRDLKWKRPKREIPNPKDSFPETLHRAVLAGIPSHIGFHQGKKLGYKGARDRTFFLFPGSGVFGKAPQWVMAFEMVETAKLYARNVSQIDPAWVETVAPHVCSHRYTHPQWVPEQGAVYAEETVIAFGLPVVEKRNIHLGRVDPAKAREIFILEALVNENTRSPIAILAPNRRLMDRVRKLEHKLRRRDGLLFPQSIFEAYNEKLPKEIHTQKAFEKWASQQPPENIALTLEDCLVPQLRPIEEDEFPDHLDGFPLSYLHDPASDQDGITVQVSLADLPGLPEWFGDWLVPGWLPEKLQSLLRALDKNLRQLIPPVANVSADFLDSWEGYEPECSLMDALLDHLRSSYRQQIEPDSFDQSRVPLYLKLRIRVIDDDGQFVASGRDFSLLRQNLAGKLETRFAQISQRKWQPRTIDTARFGELPGEVQIEAHTTGYPAFLDRGDSVELRLFPREFCGEWFHPLGVARLYQLVSPNGLERLSKVIFSPQSAQPAAQSASASGFNSLAAAFGGKAPGPSKTTAKKTNFLSSEELFQLDQTGHSPRQNRGHLLTLILLDAIGSPVPRTGDGFLSAAETATAKLFDSGTKICTPLSRILRATAVITAQLQRDDPGYQDSLSDAREHFHSLLRPGWLADARIGGLPKLEVQFRGLETRLTRMFGAPPDRDFTKLTRFLEEFDKFQNLQDVQQSPNCCGVPHPSERDLERRQSEAALRLKHFAPEYAHEFCDP